MNKKNYGDYALYSELQTFYLSNAAVFLLLPIITAFFALIETNRQKIHTLGVQQGENNKGLAINKKALKVALATEIITNSDPACAYFTSIGDLVTSAKLTFIFYKLVLMRPEKLIQVAELVISLLTTHLLVLKDSGITAATILKITTAKAALELAADLPKSKIKARNTITKEIKKTDKENLSIIKSQLTKAMRIIIGSNEAVYNEYMKIIEPTNEGVHSHRDTTVKAAYTLNMVHDLTLEPVVGAMFKITGISGSFITDAYGSLTTKLPIGIYTGKIVAINFVAQDITFTILADGLIQTIRLVPVGV